MRPRRWPSLEGGKCQKGWGWMRDAKGREGEGVLTQRRVDVGPDQPVAAVALYVVLAEAGDPALGQADADVDLAGADGGDHVAGARGEGDEVGVEAVVVLCEVEGRGEVLGHEADLEGW